MLVRRNLERYSGYLCGTSNQKQEMPEDLLQDALTVAWERFDRLAEPGRFEAWVASIMRNIHSNNAHKARRRNECCESSLCCHSSTDESKPSAQLVMEIREALYALDPQERDALLLFTLVGLSPAEICELHQCTAECVRKRLERARKKMRRAMESDVNARPGKLPNTDLLDEMLRLLDETIGRS